MPNVMCYFGYIQWEEYGFGFGIFLETFLAEHNSVRRFYWKGGSQMQDMFNENARKRAKQAAAVRLIRYCAACLAVFCTVAALIAPAFTLEKTTLCGLSEHIHEDSCYGQPVSVLSCTEATLELHTHSVSCYDENENIICGYSNFVVHSHEASCYDAGNVLVCSLPEISTHRHSQEACYTLISPEPHLHTEDCYGAEETTLICQVEESEGHTHTDECWLLSETPVCGLEEASGHTHDETCTQTQFVCTLSDEETHVHGDECYSVSHSCGLEETPGHNHSRDCYAPQLLCETEESQGHTHTDDCRSVSKPLICTLTEGEPLPGAEAENRLHCERQEIILHTHTDACWGRTQDGQGQEVQILICGQQEIRSHIHGEDCFTRNAPLVCQLPEHTHTGECYPAEETDPTDETQLTQDPGMVLVAPRPTKIIDSGTLANGEGVADAITWEVKALDDTNWILSVSGTGSIPDYTDAALDQRPWHQYQKNTNITKIVIGDGITRVGDYAFRWFYEQVIDFGSGDLDIGDYGFSGNSYLCKNTTLVIPGNVKSIGTGAFIAYEKYVNVILEEGVESLGSNCLYSPTIALPASVHTVTGDAVVTQGYTVHEDNPHLMAIDGVLYSKDGSVLVAMPTEKIFTEFRVPESVRIIREKCFASRKNIAKLYIPGTVDTVECGWGCFAVGNYQEIYIEDGVTLDTYGAFYHCANLKKVRLPEDLSLTMNAIYSVTPSLEYVHIPAKGNLGWDLTASTAVREIYYNNITGNGLNGSSSILGDCRYTLTIGNLVDTIPWGFSEISQKADKILFQGPNHITVAQGDATQAFGHALEPLTNLTGTVYVDSQGILYRYDAAAKTAELVYVSPGITAAQIPGTIPAEDGTLCTVNTVGTNALKEASGLKSIVFQDPAAITHLNAHALANCISLTSVNGKTTVEEATASFTAEDLTAGYDPFYNTGLTGAEGPGSFEAEMDGKKALLLSRQGFTDLSISFQSTTMTWQDGKAGSGGYHLLTGDSLSINATVGNTSGTTDCVYRVYFHVGEKSKLNVTPGKSYTYDNGLVATCCATEDPRTVYLEFTPPEGSTNTVFATEVYPSPSSAGGQITVWGRLLTRQEAADSPNALLKPTDGQTLQAYWTTKPDRFTLTKASLSDQPQLVGDGTGSAIPDRNISWSLEFARESTISDALGKDLVNSVDYTDVFTFPTGMNWAPDVIEAARNGTASMLGGNIYAGQTKIVSISCSGSSIFNARLEWDETLQTVVIRWTVRNPSRTEEIGAATFNLTLYPQAVRVDMSAYNPAAENVITNTANARVHYHYSADAQLESSATRTVGGGSGKLQLTKTADRVGMLYFGEDITYTVHIRNVGGLPYVGGQGIHTLTDSMDDDIYITPENMERMFAEHPDLQVTIYPATLDPWVSVTGVDGTASWQHPGNSPSKNENHRLTVTWDKELYHVDVYNDKVYSATTVAQALREAGYAVTSHSTYVCNWPLNTEEASFTVNGNTPVTRKVYATFKNSFQNLTQDWPTQYPSNLPVWMMNSASVKDPAGKYLCGNNIGHNVYREAVVNKAVLLDGIEIKNTSAVQSGDVLEYRIDFTHYGTGKYEDLPFVDDIYGSQYLLVPKASNTALAGLPEHGNFYCLTPGTYSGVTVGVDDEGTALIADSVTVTEVKDGNLDLDGGKTSFSGLHTKILWYYPELPGEEYLLSISYQTLVDLSLGDLSYTISNIAWINNKPDCRIFASTFGAGSMMENKKHIITTLGSSPENDVLAEESLVAPGQQVTYRLDMCNTTGDATATVRGNRIADILPSTFEVFRWEKGVNVTGLRIVGSEGVTWNGIDDWYIGDSFGNLLDNHSQYILWPETTTVTIPADGYAYVYVTLTYPGSDEADTWNQFANQSGGEPLRNTFYFYDLTSVVTHHLRESGRVLLQKGVTGMYYEADGRLIRPAGNSRVYYNNRDSRTRLVAYYVLLSNQGNKRLYLSDLVDTLPAGFTFHSIRNGADIADTYINNDTQTYTLSGFEPFGDDPPFLAPSDLLYRKASVTATNTKEGVTFAIANGSQGDLPYDSERQMYYLNRNEAIAFVYLCSIGFTTETTDDACNTVRMAYCDYLDTGAVMVSKDELPVTAASFNVFTDLNDGSRRLSDIQSQTWLASDVTVHRGKIIPGITKAFTGYTDTAADVRVDAPPSVTPSSDNLIHWSIRLQNSGTLSITDYTVTDTMPAPYVFQGDVALAIYDRGGNEMARTNLLTIPERTGTEQTLTVFNIHDQSVKLDLTDPTPVSLRDVKHEMFVSLTRDEAGNEVLSLHCQDANLSIPEGGSAELVLSSRNPTTSFQNAVYTNRASLIPNVQPFTKVGQGSMISKDGSPVGVQNSAPLTVSFGYSTTSEKRVAEKANTNNAASSKGPQVIWLENAQGIFTYTLCVSNDTPKAMTKLVFIDNLPQPGDVSPFDTATPRGSEFRVDLAQTPGFRVTVAPENGESYNLDSSSYTISYSTGTDFGGPQSADWQGESTGTTAAWTSNPAGARAIRLVIRDDSGTLIPPKAKVFLHFDARISGTALPGQKAWNSFGYHYSLQGISQELEAMPLPVAVAIPNTVSLVKELVNPDGTPARAYKDLTFRFTITRESDSESRTVSVNVAAGESASQMLSLADLWTWTPGERYTVTELAPPEGYHFASFDGSTDDSFVFTYDPADTPIIRCVNMRETWSAELTKTDRSGAPLSGALFGLYSPDSAEQIDIPGEYSGLEIPASIMAEGNTWYLAQIAESSAEGTIRWDNLLMDRYWLEELQAPAGYQISESGQLLERPDSGILEVTVVNEQYYELPESGGIGTESFLLLGSLMTCCSGLCLGKQRRRKQNQSSECKKD